MGSNACAPSAESAGGRSLNHQDHFVHEGRPKTVSQLLLDSCSLAPFDAGCGLQATLGMKREWEKRNGCCEDDP